MVVAQRSALVLAILATTATFGDAQVHDKSAFASPQKSSEYKLWDSFRLYHTMKLWEQMYPDLVTIETTQEKYGLPRAGTEKDCLFDTNEPGCPNHFLTIQDTITHPISSESSRKLPELLLSAGTRGDLKLGTTIVMEAAALLLEATSCEAMPRMVETVQLSEEVARAKECRILLEKKGINDARRKWIARLVASRRIVILPAVNALGFSRNEPDEDHIDPDSDFPYASTNNSCMNTITARSINEIFHEHIFQVVISFSGEDKDQIGYSWGSQPFCESWDSPDMKAQQDLAYSQEIWSNTESSVSYSNTRTSTTTGIFEDWAYAASWDFDRTGFCQSNTFGGYTTEPIPLLNNVTNRAISLKVSTKYNPTSSGMGSLLTIFNDGDEGVVSRNIRKALTILDLVQPYLSITTVGSSTFTDDLVPQQVDARTSCSSTKAVSVPSSLGEVDIHFTAGGGLSFSQVELWYAKLDEIAGSIPDCLLQPSFNVRLDARFRQGRVCDRNELNSGLSVLRGSVDLSQYEKNDILLVIAVAQFDEEWSSLPAVDYDFDPRVAPQSHVINARRNEDWHHTIDNGKSIQGRLDWYSTPVILILENYNPGLGTILLRDRFRSDGHNSHGSSTAAPKGVDGINNSPSHIFDPKYSRVLLCVFIAVSVLLLWSIFYRRILKRRSARYCESQDIDAFPSDTSQREDNEDFVFFENLQESQDEASKSPIYDFDFAEDELEITGVWKGQKLKRKHDTGRNSRNCLDTTMDDVEGRDDSLVEVTAVEQREIPAEMDEVSLSPTKTPITRRMIECEMPSMDCDGTRSIV